MALKDWRKTKTIASPNTTDIWVNEKGVETTIEIEKEKNGYSVNFWVGEDIMTGVSYSKKFKTKQQALKYAKNYMRKN